MNNISLKKNYILNTILQITLIIIPLITTPYVSRVLGANKVGEYSYSLAMATYFILFSILGTTSYGQRQIAYTRNDKEQLSITFWNTFFFRVISTSIAFFGYLVYLSFTNNFNLTCLVLSLSIINTVFDITWFYQGIENFRQVVYKNIIVKILSLILTFVLVRNQNDLWIYAIIVSGSTLLGSLTIWFSIKKYITFPKGAIKPFNNFKDIILIFLPTIAIQIYTILDKSMIGWITNSSYANGCYDRAEQISRTALTIVTSVAAVILPRVSNLFAVGDVDKAKEYVYKAYRFVWFLSIPIAVGLFVVSPTLIPLFLGDGYDDSIILLRIFSLLTVFVSLAYVTGLSYLVSTKQQNIYTISVSISAVVNFLMNIFLIRYYSAIGAAISSVCAEFVGCAIQIGYCINKKQLSLKRIFGSFWKYFLCGIGMFFITSVISMYEYHSLLVKLLIIIFSGIISYFLLLIALRDSLLLNEIKSISRRLFKKCN